MEMMDDSLQKMDRENNMGTSDLPTGVVEVVQAACNANAVLIGQLPVKVVEMEQQRLAAINNLALLQLLNQHSAKRFLSDTNKKVRVRTRHAVGRRPLHIQFSHPLLH